MEEEQETHLVFLPQTWVQEISVNIKDMKNIMYTNQTGQFLVMSKQGNRYIMMLFEADENLILVEQMKNRTLREMCKAYEKLMQWKNQRGIKIKKHILDNEASDKFLEML